MSTQTRRTTTQRPTKFRRVVGWGDALLLEVNHNSPGLGPVVKGIQAAVGRQIGVRNTFAKLYSSDEAPEDEVDQFRAWLVLTALRQDPAEWNISDDVVPAGYDKEGLRTLVQRESPWIPTWPGCQLAMPLPAA